MRSGGSGQRGYAKMLMRPHAGLTQSQRGVMLIEALVGILIFSIGILAIIMMQTQAISAQSDAQYRIEAANFASQLASTLWLNTTRNNGTVDTTSIASFDHQTTSGAWCAFSGSTSTNSLVSTWVDKVSNASSGLPGVQSNMLSVATDTTASGYNKVTIQVCWKSPTDARARKHILVTYIN